MQAGQTSQLFKKKKRKKKHSNSGMTCKGSDTNLPFEN